MGNFCRQTFSNDIIMHLRSSDDCTCRPTCIVSLRCPYKARLNSLNSSLHSAWIRGARMQCWPFWNNRDDTLSRGSRGKLAGKSVFLQIIGNDNANISAFSPQHTYW